MDAIAEEGHGVIDVTEELEKMPLPADNIVTSDLKEDTSCGIKIPFRDDRLLMPMLQRFASPKCSLALLSMAYFFSDGIGSGVFSSTISTVEKQFQLHSTETGLIAATVDIGSCVALLATIYFGENLLKTQWIGSGIVFVIIGSVIFVTPQYTSAEYGFGEEDLNYCGNVTLPVCDSSPLRGYRYVFMTGTFFIGLGLEYVTTIPLSYLDENVKQSYSSLYHGIFNGVGAIGLATGYMLGGISLQLYNNPTKSVSITIDSSLWVGAWWLFFIVGAAALLFIVLPVFLLPSHLSRSDNVRRNREHKINGEKDIRRYSSRVGSRLLSLSRNKLFVAITVSETFHACLTFGVMTYAVKIGVDLYGMSESTASLALGSLSIISTVLGYISGGALISKFRLKLKGILQFMLACSVLSSAFSFGFLIHCPGKKLGIVNHNTTNAIEGPCNAQCHCTTENYSPVCDDDGSLYFSPCHAGCRIQDAFSIASDCECLAGKNITTSTVSSAKCVSERCTKFPLLITLMFLCFLSAFLGVTPSTQATLRSVAFDERTTAISVQRVVQIVFGRIVGRLTFGAVFDNSCLISSSECGAEGACRVYDSGLVSRNLTILMTTGKICIVVVLLYAIGLARRRPDRRRNANQSPNVQMSS